jgi:feruloyl-CoA synthase
VFLTEAARGLGAEQVAQHLRQGLRSLKADGGGSSQTPTRLLPLPDSPNAGEGEITDKGYVNQRMVLSRRAADVQALYATGASGEPTDTRVITL